MATVSYVVTKVRPSTNGPGFLWKEIFVALAGYVSTQNRITVRIMGEEDFYVHSPWITPFISPFIHHELKAFRWKFMQEGVLKGKSTDVSEEHITSISAYQKIVRFMID
jgi:hypothetical protein